MSNITIKALKDGPLLVQGEVELLDSEGNQFKLAGENTALCRCGGSGRKPFCDGTHSRAGFQSSVSAKE
jgi:CDGSH-type Zn-finger protein